MIAARNIPFVSANLFQHCQESPVTLAQDSMTSSGDVYIMGAAEVSWVWQLRIFFFFYIVNLKKVMIEYKKQNKKKIFKRVKKQINIISSENDDLVIVTFHVQKTIWLWRWKSNKL